MSLRLADRGPGRRRRRRSPRRVDAAARGATSSSSTRERKGQDVTDDLRPSIEALQVAGPTAAGAELVAELGTQPRGLRPAELVAALGTGEASDGPVSRRAGSSERTSGCSATAPGRNPCPTATSAPHATARAS